MKRCVLSNNCYRINKYFIFNNKIIIIDYIRINNIMNNYCINITFLIILYLNFYYYKCKLIDFNFNIFLFLIIIVTII